MQELTELFLALGLLVAVGRASGELARALRQPVVVGEIVAGILLGPSVVGRLLPGLISVLAPSEGGLATILTGLGHVAVVLLLFVAGTEVRLQALARQGRVAASVSLAGILVPWTTGFAAAHWFGASMGRGPHASPTLFALFFATAMSISAMAVIARTLMDINLFRSDLGMTIMAAAVCEDFVGWTIFAGVLSMLGDGGAQRPVLHVVGLTLAFAAVLLTVGRRLLHRALPHLLAHSSWPQGLLGAMLACAFLAAAATAHIGVHAVFGAFLAGVALSDAPHMRARAQLTLRELVESFFAPLFFTSIGLRLDFTAHFRLDLVLGVLLLGTFGKVAGCSLGALLAGVPRRQALAIGCGMNARGSMEIILGLIGLSHGIIGEELFVALVLMTVTTAAASGPLMQALLGAPRQLAFTQFAQPAAFIPRLEATNAPETIAELVAKLAPLAGLGTEKLLTCVLAREASAPTGIGHGLAIPHSRIPGLARPLLAVGLSQAGINFQAPDGRRANLVFLLLTPKEDEEVQLAIVADIARTFAQRPMVQAARACKGFTDFLALVRTREA